MTSGLGSFQSCLALNQASHRTALSRRSPLPRFGELGDGFYRFRKRLWGSAATLIIHIVAG
jgi:hypothetical protein